MNEKRKTRIFIFKYTLALTLVISVLWGISNVAFIAFNTSDSINGTLFLIVKNKVPNTGELVAFKPPKNRFYPHRWFVKYLAAIEGDNLTYDGLNFYINGEFKGRCKSTTRDGYPLVPTGNKQIKKGRIFVWSPHRDSYDSRYKDINTISTSAIIGSAYRIL